MQKGLVCVFYARLKTLDFTNVVFFRLVAFDLARSRHTQYGLLLANDSFRLTSLKKTPL